METTGKPSQLTSSNVRDALERVSTAMNAAAAELNAADAALGDGDLGITVSRGFAEAASAQIPDDLGLAFMECAKAFQRVSSSSYGTLLATAAMSIAKALKGRTEIELSEIPELMDGALAAMMARGKASIGDKTVLDVLQATAAAMRDSPANQKYAATVGAARATLEHFKSKPNMVGRARMFGEASIGHYDPGQLALVMMLEALR